MPESKSGALTNLATPLRNLALAAAVLRIGAICIHTASNKFWLRSQQVRKRMALQCSGLPCFPVWRSGSPCLLDRHIGFMFLLEGTEDAGAGTGHPRFAVSIKPLQCFGDRREQLGGHDLQVVSSEADGGFGKVRYSDRFRISCQFRRGKNG